MRIVGKERNLPSLPGSRGESHILQDEGEQAGSDELARGDHRVVFGVVGVRPRLVAPGNEFIGFARHGGDNDRDLVPGVHLALDVARDVANSLDIGDGRAAEFHHQT